MPLWYMELRLYRLSRSFVFDSTLSILESESIINWVVARVLNGQGHFSIFSWIFLIWGDQILMILSDFGGPGAHFGGLGAHFEDTSDFCDFGDLSAAKV